MHIESARINSTQKQLNFVLLRVWELFSTWLKIMTITSVTGWLIHFQLMYLHESSVTAHNVSTYMSLLDNEIGAKICLNTFCKPTH